MTFKIRQNVNKRQLDLAGFITSFKINSLDLNVFILHRLRNREALTSNVSRFCFLGTTCGPMNSPTNDTRSRQSSFGPHDCEADVLPHDQGHHKIKNNNNNNNHFILRR